MTKSWNIDTLLPEARGAYQSIEAQFGVKVYYPMPVRRYCQNEEDVKRCRRRIRNPRYGDVLGDYAEPGAGPEAIRDRHGSFEILQAGYVDLPVLIGKLQRHFIDSNNLTDERFDYSQLQAQSGSWNYKGKSYEQVVFCEGTGISENPWFKHLPLTPAKGETLILKSETLELPRSIYHSTKWLLPYEASRFRIGATYDESDLVPKPSAKGKQELLHAASVILRSKQGLKVEAHFAGLRPSTKDARPFLGAHPSRRSLYVLNGLGSKGASLAPEMARQLFEHIFAGRPIDTEIDIHRFEKSE